MSPKTGAVIRLMTADLNRRISLGELAKPVNVSRSHLCRMFRAETGMAPGQFLQTLRLREAAELLTTTWLNVNEITEKVGYRDSSLFGRHFKNAYGLTPSRYREAHAKVSAVRHKEGDPRDEL